MEKQAATTKIYEEVYVPAFVEKCASLGINFQDQDELDAALSSAALVKQASAEIAEKQRAQQGGSVIKEAAIALARSLQGEQPVQVDDGLSEAFQALGSN